MTAITSVTVSATPILSSQEIFATAHFDSTPDHVEYKVDVITPSPTRQIRDWTSAIAFTSCSVDLAGIDTGLVAPIPSNGQETFQITFRATWGVTVLTSTATYVIQASRVQALAPGFSMGAFREVGDVWDADVVSDSTISQVPVGDPDYPLYGWMLRVNQSTPLFSYALSRGDGLSATVVASSGVNAAGKQVYGNRRRYVA